MFKAIIFDLDDTLCNTREAIRIGLRKTFKLYEHYFQVKDVEHFLSINQKAFETIYSNATIPSTSKPLLTWHKMFELMGIQPSIKELAEIMNTQKRNMLDVLKLHFGIEALISELQGENIKIGILSNGVFVDQAEKIIALGISSSINVLITPDLSLSYKPHIKSYQYILKELQVNSNDAIMVGDSVFEDLEGAKKIGMLTVLIKNDNYIESPDKHIIDYVVHSPHEISRSLNLFSLSKL